MVDIQALQSSRVQCEEERGKSAEEVERLQQTIKLQTMKTSHMQDQLEELKATHRVSVYIVSDPSKYRGLNHGV